MLKNNHFKNLEHSETRPKMVSVSKKVSQGIPLNILTLREKSRILLTNFFECYENEDYAKFL
jgi:hypothetical protein